MDNPTYFKNPEELRSWFEKNHKSEKEIWVGFFKKGTGIESITWPESVDQALCFGWIDGIRKKVDEESYKIRFTPRSVKSHWSAVNLDKVKQLKKEGLMKPEGLKIFNARDKENAKKASYESEEKTLTKELESKLRANKKANAFFKNMAPSYRKTTIHWIMSAKQEATRIRRFDILIESCLEGRKIPLLRREGE
ncbi:MAG: YdeI/OmpD-associated family protein [Cyclobacteriaceae bacterium]|nr:YdeI/OmpD-associated family protein [Cyclobacteriaceae bacterium]